MPEERKPQTDDKYIVRFPEGMRDRLKEAAKSNNRTMNAEIVARLEESFQSIKTSQLTVSDWKELLDTDVNAQRVFADQMYKAGTQLLKEDQSLKETTLELLTAAMLLAEDRRKNTQTSDTPLQTEDAIGLVQAAKPTFKKTKSSNSS